MEEEFKETFDAIKKLPVSAANPKYLLVMKYDHDFDEGTSGPGGNPDTTGWSCEPTSAGIPYLTTIEFTCVKEVEKGWFGRFK